MLYIKHVDGDDYLYSAEIRSISENISKPNRTFSVKLVTYVQIHKQEYRGEHPQRSKAIPLFIVLDVGVGNDKDIITMCLLDIERYSNMMDAFVPSIHDAV
jgi:DNA-directed RNA polymerase II subunit RPB2